MLHCCKDACSFTVKLVPRNERLPGKGGAVSSESEDLSREGMGSVNLEDDAAKRRSDAVKWLNSLFSNLNLPPEASEDELRAYLFDGTILCGVLNRLNLGATESPHSVNISSDRLENLKRFLSTLQELGLPCFNTSDLEKGPISAVLDCLFALRDHLDSEFDEVNIPGTSKNGHQTRKRWKLLEGDNLETMDIIQGNHNQGDPNPVCVGEENRRSFSKFKCNPQSPVISEPSTALLHQTENKVHEVFQSKQWLYSDRPATKLSEMLKANSIDNAPTLTLFSVVNGILDESIEKKKGEIPQRVAFLLKKAVQEIERRISTQAERIRNQNNLFKAREEKYHYRIRVLETLATGTTEETQITMNQLQRMKTEKDKIKEEKKIGEQDVISLVREKENGDKMITKLKEEMEATNKAYEHRCHQLESSSKEAKAQLEEKIKKVEFHLAESRKKIKELEASSESTFQHWNKKEYIWQNFAGLQLQSVQDLRVASKCIRQEVKNAQRRWEGEITSFGQKLKLLAEAAENYHSVVAENQRLYNELQELKGNIRVYCRIRPFLPGQNEKSTSINHIGENGELLVVNPSKHGRDGHRMFKFNKVFGSAASQEEVFLDIQPLIRSVLDGYNVCIFAYGQTGSGKTYTMMGPHSSSKEDWGVNYRALNDLFHLSWVRRDTFVYEVGVQMVEIYNEQVRDLLSNDSSQKRLGIWSTSQPNGLAVPDASMHPVRSTTDVLDLMQIGLTNRAVGATALNERSSRSHSILTVHVRGVDLKTGSTSRGCLHLVDLAGSERVDRSEVTGDRLKEAQHINRSLSALGDVIFALAQKSTHVPYRNSKLTQVLQSSLGGHAKTLMFVQINPDVESFSETVSTLKFAERVSGVELGAARSNKEGKDVRDLMEQVASLKDTITRKDEEIEQLQLVKDLQAQSPKLKSERQNSNSLRHLPTSPSRLSHGVTQQNRRLSSVSLARSTGKAASDPDNCSEFSDKHSEAGSQQSVEDFKHQRDNLYLEKHNGGDFVHNPPGEDEILGFGDADSEERLSDISDSGLSMGTETDGSISSVVEFTLFPEFSKPEETNAGKTVGGPSKIPRLPPKKTEQATSARPKLKNSLNSPSPRMITSGRAKASATKSSQRWQ